MSRPTPPTYKTRNWPAYNEALKRRGSLTIWFDPEMSWDAAPSGRRGRQQTYSDAAVQTCLTMRVLFGMALRQTNGFVESLLRLTGLTWAVPDFSTLSRRQKTLSVNIPYRGSNGRLHLLIDSTGIKVEGGIRAATTTGPSPICPCRRMRPSSVQFKFSPPPLAEDRPSYQAILPRCMLGVVPNDLRYSREKCPMLWNPLAIAISEIDISVCSNRFRARSRRSSI